MTGEIVELREQRPGLGFDDGDFGVVSRESANRVQ